jgi:hypothetical protein
MEGFAAQKLNEFETGKISRRKLIESLTPAATTLYTADSANAQADPTLRAQLVNHIPYTCPDVRQAADWYSMVFNLDQVGATKRDVALPFGKKGEQPYNVTAKDVPLTHLVVRTADQNAPPARPRPMPTIDHIALTVADFNRDRARAELTAQGVKNARGGGPGSLHMDDMFGCDVQICGLENNALTHGWSAAELQLSSPPCGVRATRGERKSDLGPVRRPFYQLRLAEAPSSHPSQPNSDLSDFGRSMDGQTQVNLSPVDAGRRSPLGMDQALRRQESSAIQLLEPAPTPP